MERQAANEAAERTRREFETARAEALELIRGLPDLETRAAVGMDRLLRCASSCASTWPRSTATPARAATTSKPPASRSRPRPSACASRSWPCTWPATSTAWPWPPSASS